MPNDFLRQCLSRLMRREDLTRDESSRLLDGLLDNEATDGQIAAVLVALAAKGESVDELTGMASALRGRAVRVNASY